MYYDLFCFILLNFHVQLCDCFGRRLIALTHTLPKIIIFVYYIFYVYVYAKRPVYGAYSMLFADSLPIYSRYPTAYYVMLWILFCTGLKLNSVVNDLCIILYFFGYYLFRRPTLIINNWTYIIIIINQPYLKL